MKHQLDITPLGVLTYKHITGILTRTSGLAPRLYFFWNMDGSQFNVRSREVNIISNSGKKEDIKRCSHFKFTQSASINMWTVTYIKTDGKNPKHKKICIACSTDLYTWILKGDHETTQDDAVLVPESSENTHAILYSGGLFMKHATSGNLKTWIHHRDLLATSRHHAFDAYPLTLMGSLEADRGNLIIYDSSHKKGDLRLIQAGAILFSKEQPHKILWRSRAPLWQSLVYEDSSPIQPLGITISGNALHLYWVSAGGSLIGATVRLENTIPEIEKEKTYLNKHPQNPILAPKDDSQWESQAVFNPAALYDNGQVHLFYRAIGNDGISVLGYASSNDGVTIDYRSDKPALTVSDEYLPDATIPPQLQIFNPAMFTSGGGWSGCEDPRAVKIGNEIFVTYLAFSGWNSMRLALTSIHEDDLRNQRWNWRAPQFLSAAGEVNKNWVLFPEKIDGKFAILHSITPTIEIHYTDSLEEFNGQTFIKSKAPSGGRREFWDTKVRGAGPPPLKTKLGWLVFYHANDMLESYKYKLGAMILDLHNPKKILYRSSHPILCPDMHYENDGKPGIVYASGAVIKDDTLFIYYGGADRVVCVASASLDEFLTKIQEDKVITLTSNPSVTL